MTWWISWAGGLAPIRCGILCDGRVLCNRWRGRSTGRRGRRRPCEGGSPPVEPTDGERTFDERRPMSEQTAYLVLGMHRSGTSAVTQLLALAGANLPHNVMSGDEHNAKGYFEPWQIAMFNDERLRAAGAAWDDVFAFPFRPLPTRIERGWITRAEALFGEEFGDASFPLLKDPRITVLMPLWRTGLGDLDVAARCVVPVRHPLAAPGSLSRRA